MDIPKKKKFSVFIIYLILYWLFGILYYAAAFGWAYTTETWFAPLTEGYFSARLIFLSSILATAIVFYFKERTLKNLPYPYFILGCHVGNLSLLILIVVGTFILKLFTTELPYLYLNFLSPLLLLLMSYIWGFAFLAMIPALGSAFCLYWINKKFI